MTRGRAMWRRIVLATVVILLLVGIAHVPTSTRRGVNFVVTSESLPLYVKALDFVDRDVNYRRLAGAITRDSGTDEEKMRAVFEWTRANVRETPDGFPIIDDHVWHVIVRGYGSDDQKADVFTTLLAYAGVPAYWIFIGPKPELALSLVRIGGAWRVVDVQNGVVFRTADGRLATVEEIAAQPGTYLRQGPPTFRGLSYAEFFAGFQAPVPPEVTRADMQMTGRRALREVKRLFGRADREWDIRPPSRVASR